MIIFRYSIARQTRVEGRGVCLLRLLRIVFGLIASVLAIYSLRTGNFTVTPYMIFSLGAMMLLHGIAELQEKRKLYAFMLFATSAFNIFISIYILFK